MIGIIVFALVLGVLISIHEFGHFIAAKRLGVRVERFSLGFGPKVFCRKVKDTEYLISLFPIGGYVKLAGDNLEEFKGKPYEYFSKAPGKRARIIVAGAALNYLMAFFCFWAIFFLGYPRLTATVGEVIEGFGAQEAGILQEDKIVRIEGMPVEYWDQLQEIIHKKKDGDMVSLSVLRDNEIRDINVRIQEKESNNLLNEKVSVGLIGVGPSGEMVSVKHGLGESLILGTRKLFEYTLLTYKAIFRMITGKLSLKESATGPLGIFLITTKTAQLGFLAILRLVALLNVSLAIFNLLPIPVLDGGHLLLLGIEKIKGRYLSPQVDKVVTNVGLAFILSLALFISYNDFIKFGLWEKIGAFLGK